MADYSQADLKTLSGFITNANAALNAGDTQNAINDVNLYYDDQVGKRGYATDALEVVNHADVFGLVANQEIIDALGATQYARLLPRIVVSLAAADFNAITNNNDDIPTENEIANYHYDVYGPLGIDQTFWGGASGAALGLDWAQGTLNAPEQGPDLISNQFYQSFTQQQTATAKITSTSAESTAEPG